MTTKLAAIPTLWSLSGNSWVLATDLKDLANRGLRQVDAPDGGTIAVVLH